MKPWRSKNGPASPADEAWFRARSPEQIAAHASMLLSFVYLDAKDAYERMSLIPVKERTEAVRSALLACKRIINTAQTAESALGPFWGKKRLGNP